MAADMAADIGKLADPGVTDMGFTDMGKVTDRLTVSVRFFAAARSAAGTECSEVALPTGSTIDDLASDLCCRSDELARVLQKCSFLCDGLAVRDRTVALQSGQTVDVLPPFAGG